MTVTETSDPSAFRSLEQDWRRLVSNSRVATIYQTWEWNEAWWATHRARKRLRLLIVQDGPDVVGIAPFYMSRHLGTPLRRLAFVGTGVSDYLDVVAREDVGERVCRAILRHLSRTPSYDLVDLQQMSPSSLLGGHLCGLAAPERASVSRISLRDQERCPYVALPSSWREFEAAIGKKMRSNIGYYERLLLRTFEDASTRLCASDSLDEGMSALFDLHQRRWRMRMLPGVLSTAKKQKFHTLVAERFDRQGWLRLHLMRAGGVIVAALYCFRYQHRYYYYLGGFDPALSKLSIGTTLTAAAIRQAIEEGCSEFDFLRGAEAYKYRWRPAERTNRQCLIARPSSLRSGAMLHLNKIERYVEHKAKSISDRRKGDKAQ